jgi:hypothetical protein
MATCTYSVPDKNASGDNLYGPRICWQPFVDYAWPAWGFNYDYWQDGWGYNDCCNTDKPLARTFNAIWLLDYSAPDPSDENWSSPILNWGCRFARNAHDDIRARCSKDSYGAYSWWGPFTDDRCELYLIFFYNLDVVGRAATLLHEARHLDGQGHDANFPSWSALGPGKSGADSSWGYEGAWMYDALYLWWFYAAGARTTNVLRQQARQRAQFIIDNAFAKHPGYVI